MDGIITVTMDIRTMGAEDRSHLDKEIEALGLQKTLPESKGGVLHLQEGTYGSIIQLENQGNQLKHYYRSLVGIMRKVNFKGRYFINGQEILPSCVGNYRIAQCMSGRKEKNMEPTIKCVKHFALHAKLTGSRFEDVCLGDAEFDNVSLARAKFHNVNLSDISVTDTQIGGATFKRIGLPPGSTGKQRPLRFEETDLNGTTILKCDLSDVKIQDCNIQGMTIDGIPVADIIAAYRQQKK